MQDGDFFTERLFAALLFDCVVARWRAWHLDHEETVHAVQSEGGDLAKGTTRPKLDAWTRYERCEWHFGARSNPKEKSGPINHESYMLPLRDDAVHDDAQDGHFVAVKDPRRKGGAWRGERAAPIGVRIPHTALPPTVLRRPSTSQRPTLAVIMTKEVGDISGISSQWTSLIGIFKDSDAAVFDAAGGHFPLEGVDTVM